MASVDIREQLNLEKNADLFKYLKMLIYAKPDAGKTYLSATAQDCTAPGFNRVLHLGFEKGLRTVAHRTDYDKKEIRKLEQLELIVNLLERDQESDNPTYGTLIVDNATELQNMDIEFVMQETKKNARDPNKVDIDVPSQREWGKIGKRLRRCVVGLRDLPMHTIWTAWENEWKDDDTKITYCSPQLSGHVKNELSGYFDIVGRLTKKVDITTETTTRNLQVMGTEKITAKWRQRNEEVVPGILENPTIPMVWDYVGKSIVAKD